MQRPAAPGNRTSDISVVAARAVLTAVVATGALLGILALWEEENATFLGHGRSLIWEAGLVFQNALWAGVSAILVGLLRRLREAPELDRGSRRRIAAWTAAILVLASAGAVPTLGLVPEYALKDEWWSRVLLAVYGLCVMALAIVTMTAVGATSRRILDEPSERQLAAYLDLRAGLHDVLNATAAMLGMLIVVGASLRGAIIADGVPADRFPPEYFVYFGGFYSALLAFAYAPAYWAFRTTGTELRDRLLPLPVTAPDSWAAWHGDRKALDALLELDGGGPKSLRTGLALLTPLIGSGAGLVLGIGA